MAKKAVKKAARKATKTVKPKAKKPVKKPKTVAKIKTKVTAKKKVKKNEPTKPRDNSVRSNARKVVGEQTNAKSIGRRKGTPDKPIKQVQNKHDVGGGKDRNGVGTIPDSPITRDEYESIAGNYELIVCEDSLTTGKHSFSVDYEYDSTGRTISCEHCGDNPHTEKCKCTHDRLIGFDGDDKPFCRDCGGYTTIKSPPLELHRNPPKIVREPNPIPVGSSVLTPKTGFAAKMAEAANQPPHVVVEAFAGTGKTFTQIMGVAWAFAHGMWDEIVRTLAVKINEKAGCQKVDPDTFEVIPSDEQQLVWDALAQSHGHAKTITYCAFNKSIVTEFSETWGWLVQMLSTLGITLQFATVNALGFQTVRRAYGYKKPTGYRNENLIGEILGVDPREYRKDPSGFALLKATDELAGLCKLTLAGWDEETGFDSSKVNADVLQDLCDHFDIEVNGNFNRIAELVPQVLQRSLDPSTGREISFDDQNWLPVVNKLPVSKVDLLLVDEGQDLPRCKQEFARMMGRRIVLVGDVNQAIYGFAGADVDSIPRMRQLLSPNETPLEPLRLTETRRCGKAIVAEAQAIVPDFKAHESNPDGMIRYAKWVAKMEKPVDDTPVEFKDGMPYQTLVGDNDMILCRVNAPLVSQALQFIKSGRKAVIRGRNFGGQLIDFVKKLKAADVPSLIQAVDDWYHTESQKENKRRNPSESKLMAIEDKKDCVIAFTEDATSVADVIEKISLVFAGKECPHCKRKFNEDAERCGNYYCKVKEKDPDTGYDVGAKLMTPKGIIFSSVHRAKGLESDRVFILTPKGASMPHPLAKTPWQKGQEMNLKYVAITRAIHELVWVTE